MRLRVLAWAGHAHYLQYLACVPHEIVLVADAGARASRWPDGVHTVAPEEVRRQRLDCILFQSRHEYLGGADLVLSEEQRRLPRIYLEHEAPGHAGSDRHVVDDPEVLLVHVSQSNALAWDSGRTPVRVIEHGVRVRDGVLYSGKLPRGVAVVDDLGAGRRSGADIVDAVRSEVRLDVVGRGARAIGGLGEVAPERLAEFLSAYRFYFEPRRSASLSLAACEAMAIGLPVVGVASAELATVVARGVTGHLESSVRGLVARMRELLASPGEAWRLGQAARRLAQERFDLRRFVRDWDHALRSVAGASRGATRADSLRAAEV